jgi:hypothetical protein
MDEDVAHYERMLHLHKLCSQAKTLEDLVAEAVVSAKRNGATWHDIGKEAGISRQAAHKRWGQLVTEAPVNFDAVTAEEWEALSDANIRRSAAFDRLAEAGDSPGWAKEEALADVRDHIRAEHQQARALAQRMGCDWDDLYCTGKFVSFHRASDSGSKSMILWERDTSPR